MAIGFVTIITSPAKEHDVYNQLLGIDEIVDVHPLFGAYDIIAKIDGKDFNEVGRIVVDKIRVIPGVIETSTMTVSQTDDMPSYYRK